MVQDVSSWQLTENGKGHAPVGNRENLAKQLSEEAWGLKILPPPNSNMGGPGRDHCWTLKREAGKNNPVGA